MADLIDRISGADGQKINLHRWIGYQRLYAYGVWTRAQVAAEFNIVGADEIRQATQIADNVDAQSNATNKGLYIARVEAVMLCVEDYEDTGYHAAGVVNKPKVFTDLLIAG